MLQTIPGARIRERRRQVGLTQVELAQRMGISPSYLNLIERNKRGIAGPLLRKAADALKVGLEDLDGAAERRLAETLQEIAHLPALAGLGIETAGAGELVGRYPGWSRALATLARAEHEASATARALADRLIHDPFLGETVHRMLTRTSAIRSAAEILTEYADVTEAQRDRFHRIIHEESRSLSAIAEALAAYFDRIDEVDRTLTPLEEVEALFEARQNHFAEIEAADGDLATRLTATTPEERRREARSVVETHLGATIDGLIARQSQIETAAARERARRALTEYAIGVALAPLDTFEPLAAETGYDIETLAERLTMDVETVCRRLTALRRRDGRPRFGYLKANAAGTIIEMLGLPGLAVPRYAAACPLWILYRAQQTPETVQRQLALFPSGLRFIFVARARNTGERGFGKPRHYVTDMVAMSEADARHTVYASDHAEVEEVGPACRLCPRRTCPQRVEDPLAE